jgi:hypothetical protein
MAGHRKNMLDIQRIIQLKARGESTDQSPGCLGLIVRRSTSMC